MRIPKIRLAKPRRGTVLILTGAILLAGSGIGGWLATGHHVGLPHHGHTKTAWAENVTVPFPTEEDTADAAAPPGWAYGVMDGHWTHAKADWFRLAENRLGDADRIIVNHPPQKLPTAEEVQRKFLVAVNQEALWALDLTTERMRGHYATVDWLQLKLMKAAETIEDARLAITTLARVGALAPKDYESSKVGDTRLVEQYVYKSAIRGIADQLKGRLHQIGDEIAAGEPGIAAGSPGAHHIQCMVDYGLLTDGDKKLREVSNARPGERVEGIPDLNFPVATVDGVVTTCHREDLGAPGSPLLGSADGNLVRPPS